MVPVTGRAIRKARRARGWTQPRLAKVAGISAMHLSRIERGKGGTSLEVLLKLARALNLK